MKLIDRYNEMKKKYSKSIILIKSGIFYETFNDDAYIMNYIFDYKIKTLSGFVITGFPEKVLDIVKDRLKKEKISYVVLDNNHPFVSDKNPFTESNYEILFDVSYKSYNVKREIEKINQKLDVLKSTKSIDEIINKIKNIIWK